MKRFLLIILITCLLLCSFLCVSVTPASAEMYAVLNQRMATRTGPGTEYDEPGTFYINGWQNVQVKVISRSHDSVWALVEFEYKGSLLRVYTGFKRLNGIRASQVPEEGYMGTVDAPRSLRAYYGPGTNYKRMEHDVPARANCDVIMIENGFALVDYRYPTSTSTRSRSWVRAEDLPGYESYSNTPQTAPPQSNPGTPSSFGEYVRYGTSWWVEEPEWSYADISALSGNELSVHMFFYRIADIYGTITLDSGNMGNHGTFRGYFDVAPNDPITGEVWFFEDGWAIDMNAEAVDARTGAAFHAFPGSLFVYYYR